MNVGKMFDNLKKKNIYIYKLDWRMRNVRCLFSSLFGRFFSLISPFCSSQWKEEGNEDTSDEIVRKSRRRKEERKLHMQQTRQRRWRRRRRRWRKRRGKNRVETRTISRGLRSTTQSLTGKREWRMWLLLHSNINKWKGSWGVDAGSVG